MQRVTPTKTNLQRLKRRIRLAKEGYELLEQKREILIQEVLSNVSKLKIHMRDIYKKFNASFQLYKRALATNGELNLNFFLENKILEPEIEVTEKTIMGAVIPRLKLKNNLVELISLDFEYDESVDQTRRAYSELLNALVEWTEVYVAMLRLSRELKKTNTLVKSLENNIIPTLSKQIKQIETVLEENEREEFIRRKMLKKIK